MPDAFVCIILFQNWSILGKVMLSSFTDEKTEAVSRWSQLGRFSVPSGTQAGWDDWISWPLKQSLSDLESVSHAPPFPSFFQQSPVWASCQVFSLGAPAFWQEKNVLQADWILWKGVESSHGNCVSFSFSESLKEKLVGVIILITATHLQKPSRV